MNRDKDFILAFNYDLSCFSDNYQQARAKFQQAAQALSGQWRSYTHPLSDERQPLSTDLFWLGSELAENVLVLISATHGVEGYCGSAAQVQYLRYQTAIPSNTAVLLIHALNPFGFQQGRRVNEDNVDLNRNFIDFKQVPVNSGYSCLAGALSPANADELSLGEKVLCEYRQQHGQSAYEQAVSGGQYDFSNGLFYGGAQPSWSRQIIEKIKADFRLAERRRLTVIDFHSGLGPYGYGEIICDHPAGSKNTALAKKWFGDSVTEPVCGNSSSVPKFGLLDYAWYPAIGDKGCFVTLEFGTYSVAEMLRVLREENFYWHQPVDSTEKRYAQQRLRDYFYPAKKDWQEMILFRSAQVIAQALQGIVK